MEYLGTQLTEKQLRTALTRLPEGLSNTYENALERIQAQPKNRSEIAMRALKWITFSRARLNAIQLQHALAVTSETTSITDCDLIDIRKIISLCAGLVTCDKSTAVVRLVHYTSQAFLQKKLGKREANAEIGRTSLHQLLLVIRQIELHPEQYYSPSDGLSATFETSHCLYHVREGGEEDLRMDIIEAFRTQALRKKVCQLSDSNIPQRFRVGGDEDISLLQISCLFGLPKLCRDLLWPGRVP